MKTKTCNSFVVAMVFALLCSFSAGRIAAQSSAQQTAASESAHGTARITQPVNEAQRVQLSGNVHPLARPENEGGVLSDAQPVNRIWLLLKRSDAQEAALHQLMEEQQTPGSSNYHAWLTPQQFGEQFGPVDADIQAVKDWLSSKGFRDIQVSPGRTVIQFNGTAGLVRNAFHTELHRYTTNGEEHFANASDPQVPAALVPVVGGVVSLHNFRKKPFSHQVGKFRRDLTTGEIRPLFTFTDVNGTFFGMGPGDFRTIYNIPVAADGAGQSIAIVGRSNINIQDVRDFRTMFGLPPNDPQIILNGADPGLVSGDEGEADLDVEWSGAIASAATIKFVVSESTSTDAVDGVDASAQYIVDNNVAPVMSESFGSCEAQNNNTFQNALWQQAAAEGITVSVSSGDNGSAGCDNPSGKTSAAGGTAISGTASTPYNVAVGGTDFDDAGNQSKFWNQTAGTVSSALSYIPEVPWNDSCGATGLTGCDSVASGATNLNIVAGSGGPSTIYTKTNAPWQTGFGDSARDIPDVSFFASDGGSGSTASKSFYIVCESDQNIAGATGCNLTTFTSTAPFHDFQAVGGTSASSPAFAGIMALVNQATGQRQGNANVVLYSLAKSETFTSCNSATVTTGNTCVFYDVTKNTNSVPCAGGSKNCSKTSSGGFGVLASGGTAAFTSGVGYDLATGLGSINVANLLLKWAAAVPGRTGSSTTLAASATTTTVDSSVTLSGAVTKSSGTGTPSGVVVFENAATSMPVDSTTLDGSGNYSINTAFLPGGTYNLIAHYGGDNTFAASDSAPVALNVSKQGSQVIVGFVGSTGAISTAAQSVAYGSPYILRIDVANSGGTACENINAGTVSFRCPTGTITLKDNGAALNDFPTAQTAHATNVANLNDRGFVEDQPIQLNVGSHSITAAYVGDSSYNPQATSNSLSVTITQAATTTAMQLSPGTVTAGSSTGVGALVSTQSNSSQGPTGTVQFFVGSTAVGNPVSCTPTGATSSAGASCQATTTVTLSMLLPPGGNTQRRPGPPVGLLPLLLAMALILAYLATRMASSRQRRYAYALALFLLASAIGVAGCGGSSGGGGGGTHTDSVHAVYSGDANYSGSTSPSVSITVQ